LKILFYNHTGTASGAERVLLMILKELNHQAFNPVVLCPPEGRLPEMVNEVGVRIIHINSLKARFTWRVDHLVRYLASFMGVIQAARSIILSEAPDLVHANSIRAGLVMSIATAGLKVPVIWHAVDVLPRHPLSVGVRLVGYASKRNHILAVAGAVATRFRGVLARGAGWRSRIKVIYNPVNAERFQPNSTSRREIRRLLGISEKTQAIGIVAHLTPHKGQLELIQTFADLAPGAPDAILFVIGDALFNSGTDYRNSLTRAASLPAIAGRVRFLGARNDIPNLMRGLDLLVVNSLTEAFPLTVLEGMASGTPIIATAVGGTPEMIRHKENGWLIPARDRRSLAEALLTLLGDEPLRKNLASKARRDAVARFSMEGFSAEIHSLYRGILESGKTPDYQPASNFEAKLTSD